MRLPKLGTTGCASNYGNKWGGLQDSGDASMSRSRLSQSLTPSVSVPKMARLVGGASFSKRVQTVLASTPAEDAEVNRLGRDIQRE